jgi:multiple sugar transport system permease protein
VVVLVVVIVALAWTVLLAFERVRLVDIQGMGLFGAFSLRNFTRVLTSPGFPGAPGGGAGTARWPS